MHVELNYIIYDTECIYGCMWTLRRVLAGYFGAEGSHMWVGGVVAKCSHRYIYTNCFVREAMLFRHYQNYIIAFTERTKCSKCLCLSLTRCTTAGSQLNGRGGGIPQLKTESKQLKKKDPNLAKQMSTLATVNALGEWYANECPACLRASLPDAGEPSPTGGSRGRSHRER